MRIEFKKEVDELEVCGVTFTIRIEGVLLYDDGMTDAYGPDGNIRAYKAFSSGWIHDELISVEVLFVDTDKGINTEGCYPERWVKVNGQLEQLIYEAFVEKYPADELAVEFEPDNEGQRDNDDDDDWHLLWERDHFD